MNLKTAWNGCNIVFQSAKILTLLKYYIYLNICRRNQREQPPCYWRQQSKKVSQWSQALCLLWDLRHLRSQCWASLSGWWVEQFEWRRWSKMKYFQLVRRSVSGGEAPADPPPPTTSCPGPTPATWRVPPTPTATPTPPWSPPGLHTPQAPPATTRGRLLPTCLLTRTHSGRWVTVSNRTVHCLSVWVTSQK